LVHQDTTLYRDPLSAAKRLSSIFCSDQKKKRVIETMRANRYRFWSLQQAMRTVACLGALACILSLLQAANGDVSYFPFFEPVQPPLGWVEFRNVSLRAGQKTDVQVVVPPETDESPPADSRKAATESALPGALNRAGRSGPTRSSGHAAPRQTIRLASRATGSGRGQCPAILNHGNVGPGG